MTDDKLKQALAKMLPETKRALDYIYDRDGELWERNAPEKLVTLCRKLESERDEARKKEECYIEEIKTLRTEIERAEAKTAAEYEAHKMTKCERDALKSEVERLETLYEAMKREKDDYRAQRDNIRLEADQLSTELHLERFSLKEMNAEIERLKADKARMDWLIEHGANDFFEVLSEYPSQARNAIDAAMKGAE